ncbi:MAG: tryptophan--tRNA ligase [Rickettsiales bacterium]
MKKIFSGIQPTGNIHLGNYLGAIKNWLQFQNSHSCLFGVMNLHAITIKQNPIELKKNIYQTLATYIACGLDIKKSKIFVQSQVPAHSELAWIFSTITPLGWLNRMTQFKDKTQNNNTENANLGLYSYPVLMACDILLYHTDIVPVGEDQKQHIELCRDIASAFNRNFDVDYFKLPEPLIIKETKRIMSLQDGNKKMSKSDPAEISRINLLDTSDDILKKIKKSKTDSLNHISYDESRPELFNLLNIFSAFNGKNPIEIAEIYQNSGYGKFKQDLAELLISELSPINKKINELIANQDFLDKIFLEGKEFAEQTASKTRNDVYQILGLI